MKFQKMQQIQTYFEPSLERHQDFITKYESKVFKVLGFDNTVDTKDQALKGIDVMRKELAALIEDRKQRTNIFRLIVTQFTDREKKAQDLIDRLQNKANICLQSERASIEQANTIIKEKSEEAIDQILQSDLPETTKTIIAAEAEAALQVEILDDAKSRVKYDLKFINQLGIVSLILWYITTDEFINIDLDRAEKISISNMIVLAKKYYKDSGLTLNNVEFVKIEIAK